MSAEPSAEFIADCLHWRGEALSGKYAHWCGDWDDLPIDETCSEWPCGCGIKESVDAPAAQGAAE